MLELVATFWSFSLLNRFTGRITPFKNNVWCPLTIIWLQNFTFNQYSGYYNNVYQITYLTIIIRTLNIDCSLNRWLKIVIHSCSRNIDHDRSTTSISNRVKTFAYPLRSKRERQNCLVYSYKDALVPTLYNFQSILANLTKQKNTQWIINR